jgi:predicted RNA-binding protein
MGLNMCEFRVILDGERVFEDAVYVKDDGQRLLVRDVLGQSREFTDCRVLEISVEREELIIGRV